MWFVSITAHGERLVWISFPTVFVKVSGDKYWRSMHGRLNAIRIGYATVVHATVSKRGNYCCVWPVVKSTFYGTVVGSSTPQLVRCICFDFLTRPPQISLSNVDTGFRDGAFELNKRIFLGTYLDNLDTA